MAAASVIYSAPGLLPGPASPPPALTAVENKLKYIIQNRGIRVSEFFQDYDPLRSGYITSSQFRRCLDQNLALVLTDEEFEELLSKYDNKGKGMINYIDFIESVQASFVPDKLDGKPREQIDQMLKTPSTLTKSTLSPLNKERTDHLLERCAEFYLSRGIVVKACYEDFDRHNMGYVTFSQFHRSFPGPVEVTDTEISMLAHRYYDPLIKLYNYYRFNDDIRSIWEKEGGRGSAMKQQSLLSPVKEASSIQDIINRIRDTVYKYGIRTTEFFTDFDKLRSGLVTENQFVCGLSLLLAKRGHITRDEVGYIVRRYSTPDGQVNYREFCHQMENAYNKSDFEKNPTDTVYRPPRGHLHKPLNDLSPADEERLFALLSRLREQVKKRRLLLYPYFRDFDRKKGFTRGVTKSQFERLFQFLSLSISPDESNLIEAKFGDPLNGDINYSALIQGIDEEYTGQIVDPDEEDFSRLSICHSSLTRPQYQEPINIGELMGRIQEHVSAHRIRACEYFQDFDPLRSGFISTTRFRQGLSALGLANMPARQFNGLADYYTVNKENTGPVIAWKEFVKDVDDVFLPMPQKKKIYTLPVTGSVDFISEATDDQKALLQSALDRLRDQINQKRILVKPCFQDFDRHNCGRVTRKNFRQCFSYLELSVSEEEGEVLEMRFCDAKGFNYLKLLQEIQPRDVFEDNYDDRITTIRTDTKRLEDMKKNFSPVSVAQVLYKIRAKVVRERIRVLEFLRDYDKLRSGRILGTVFHRALDLCGFELSPSEIHALENEYRSVKDSSYVDYVLFSDDVESVFTIKELEKMPTLEVMQFKPPEDVDLNQLSPSDEEAVHKALHKLAESVRVRHLPLFPPFEDYDKVHKGNVTTGQFKRVLDDLSLMPHLSQFELNLICLKFGVVIGGRHDINYNAFCLLVEDYAQTKWNEQ